MRSLLVRIWTGLRAIEHLIAVLLILLAGLQFGVAASDARPRGVQLALLALVAGLYWYRSIFRRRANRDVTKAVAGLAEAAAMAFLREREIGDLSDRPTPTPRDVLKVRTLFISDVHLGTKGCQAEQLVDFLRQYDAGTVYLVGDIVDGWYLRSNWYWPSTHNVVIQELVELARRGKRLVYVAGNHDDFIRNYTGSTFGAVEVVEYAIHNGLDGRDYLVVHGDHFDLVVRHARWLALLGDFGYRTALTANVWLNWVRSRFGLAYWSLSSWAKLRVKNAVNYIGCYEEVLSSEARRHHTQGVICGHIHQAAMHDECGIRYINTGDWVESCTSVVEHHDGRFEIIRWTEVRPQQMSDEASLVPFARAVA